MRRSTDTTTDARGAPLALLPAVLAQSEFRLFPRQASRHAAEVDAVYLGLVAFSVFFTLVICLLILYFVARYHAGSSADRRNPITKTVRYEILWVSVPLVFALGLFTWAAKGYIEYAQPPEDARTIYVVGKQWMWKVQHPAGRREINELHVPVGEPIKLVMTSQDVIHDFFVPAFRVKRDVLPDRYTELWFTATEPGVYHLFCAEYCGADHSQMVGRVVAMRPAEFEAWLSPGVEAGAMPGTPGTLGAPMALRGEGAFYSLGCNACHVPDAAVRAPQLGGLFGGQVRLRNDEIVIADEQYIRESILYPNAKIVAGYEAPSLMPTYKGQISEQQLQEVVEYVKSLEHGWPEEVAQ